MGKQCGAPGEVFHVETRHADHFGFQLTPFDALEGGLTYCMLLLYIRH